MLKSILEDLNQKNVQDMKIVLVRRLVLIVLLPLWTFLILAYVPLWMAIGVIIEAAKAGYGVIIDFVEEFRISLEDFYLRQVPEMWKGRKK